MNFLLIATFGIFVISTSVKCSTSTLTEETVTETGGVDIVSDSDITRTTETVSSSQQLQSLTEIGTTEKEVETTTLRQTLNNITTELSTGVEEITTVVITASNENMSSQSDILTTDIGNDEPVANVESNDDVLTTNSIDLELGNNETMSTTVTAEIVSTAIMSSNDLTDNSQITVTVNDDKEASTSNVASVENDIVVKSKKIVTNDSNCVFVSDSLTSDNNSLMFKHTIRYQFVTWQDLKENNETNQVNMIIFAHSIDVTEWFVIYDQIFREVFSELLTERWKQLGDYEDTFMNCTSFTSDDIIYVSPSPFKLRKTTVVGFMICNQVGQFCLVIKLLDMEIERLENKLNLSVLEIENGHILMDYHYDCYGSPTEIGIIFAAIVTGVSAMIGLTVCVGIALCRRRKSGSFNTRVVSFMNLPAFGRNLATDQQCQMEELSDTSPRSNNQHRQPPSTPYEIRRSVRHEGNVQSTITTGEEPPNNKDVEAQL